jgi:plastocyanin
MSHRLWRRSVVAMLVLALALLGGTAIAAPKKKASNKATINLLAPIKVKVNKFIQDGARFRPGDATIKSGGTLTLNNKSGAPHTFSIVKESDVPKSKGKILNCGSPKTICETLFVAHQPDADGNPTVPTVDVGQPGIDAPGDSLVLNPKQKETVKVSAKKGTELYFMCAIHAWMQGELKVR